VNLRWVYYKTSKPYKSEVTYTTVTREHVMRTLAMWEELAVAGPLRAKALGLRGSQLPKNARACGRYGGCPHKDVRCRLTREERIEAAMSTQPDLLAMINHTKEALSAQPPVPPPPLTGGTAPLLGVPTLPPSMQPPPFPIGAPPMAGLPPVPALAAYVQAAPPPPPPPVQVAPPPPPPPVQVAPPPPSLPAPWVLSQDPAWAYNTVTQQFEQTARLLAPPPPPVQVAAPPLVQAAPPPPAQAAPPPSAHQPSVTADWSDEERKTIIAWIRAGASDQQIAGHFPHRADALQQLRKDLVTIDEYTSRTTAPANPVPLKPEEIYGLKTAIQNGASDMQILAAYPHARGALDGLRLEVQGGQRATGINAPESTGQPPLSEPSATPATPAAPADADPSKKGDAYDSMGVEQLRAIAKAHDIEVKGMREKNLRITVRTEMARRGASIPTVPQTPSTQLPQVQMQPPQLPNVFATPAPVPSIAQAVQMHLQPPATASALTPEQVREIRRALDAFNVVGDVLRKLIGAD
jgi:uncharacterized protein (DUF433 family)